LLVTVERNEDIQTQIGQALFNFLEDFSAAFERLCEINGGPPKRRTTIAAPGAYSGHPKPEHEFEETIP
jgi:hypothetical protein